MRRFVLQAVPDLDDVSEPEGARRGGAPRHRRRPAAGPGGDRLGRSTSPTRPADVVAGGSSLDACRYYEFRVIELDDRDERTTIAAETVAEGRLRDFFGFNRAKHAVVEAAILATRTRVPPDREDPRRSTGSWRVLVEKTGGPAEREAFALLTDHVQARSPAAGVSARTTLDS